MEMYINHEVKKYLNDLSAKLPAPGGGSASALVGATGVALLSMVVNFTVNKKGYEIYQSEISQLMTQLDSLQAELESLVDADVEAYSKVSMAYSLPKNSDFEKQQRDFEIQKVLKIAMQVPKQIVEYCHQGIMLAERIADIGNKNLITDVACGVLFLMSALVSAKYNVDVYLKFMNDPDFVDKTRKEISDTVIESESFTKITLEKVNKILG